MTTPTHRSKPLQSIEVAHEEGLAAQSQRLERLSSGSPVLVREMRSLVRRSLSRGAVGSVQARRLLEMLGGVGLLMLVGGWVRQWMHAA